MIQFSNVSKTYVSKKKARVDALRNVSFELGNTGMVFILGKSGSGKSTLLNLLGGLDSPTSGEIIVDGVSMRDFKPADYDGYRNGYVGFIFQEFNLLDDFNVKENVAFALQLSRGQDIDDKVTDALRQVELSEEYLTRRVSEVSGGERQRVAIARSIVKDSKMILADEPTGNLDSVTGESIWKILKNLSETKLVVVVSHDRESAEKYADRIIEIADGRIVADNGRQDVTSEDEVSNGSNPVASAEDVTNSSQPVAEGQSATLTLTKKRLPLLACLKMGVNNLLQRKVKNIFIVILSMLCIALLLVSEMALFISPERALARFIKQNDVPYFLVNLGSDDDDNRKQNSLNFIQEHSKCILDGVVESKQEVLDFGFTFVGDALELDSNSFYTFDYWMTWIDCVEIDGEMVGVEIDAEKVFIVGSDGKRVTNDEYPEGYPITFLVGKRVNFHGITVYDGNYPTLAGIINADERGIHYNGSLDLFFAKANFESRPDHECNYTINANNAKYMLEYGAKSSTNKIKIIQSNQLHNGGCITADSQVGERLSPYYDLTLADGEIVLSYNMYAALFDNVGKKDDYVSTDENSIWNIASAIPEHLGQTFSLKLYDKETGELLVDAGEYKLAGVYFEDDNDEDCQIVLSQKVLRDLWQVFKSNSGAYIQPDSVRNLQGFLTKLVGKYGGSVIFAGCAYTEDGKTGDIQEFVYKFADRIGDYDMLFWLIGAILLFVLLLLVVSLITFSITGRTKEIGILMGLGASNRDVTKIFIFEALVISVLSFVFALCTSFVFAAICNAAFSASGDFATAIPLLGVDYITLIVLLVVSFGFVLFAAWLPLLKVSKLKPIDAIRHL